MAVTLRTTKGSRLTHAEMDENWKSVMGGHNFLHVQDQKPQGTSGGTFTAGAWQTRDLNTVLTNTITGASLATNQITLPAGKYYVEASAHGCAVSNHVLAIRKVVDSSLFCSSVVYYIGHDTNASSVASTQGIIDNDGISVYALVHRCSITKNTNGLGTASGFTTEVYSDIRIWRIGEYVAP